MERVTPFVIGRITEEYEEGLTKKSGSELQVTGMVKTSLGELPILYFESEDEREHVVDKVLKVTFKDEVFYYLISGDKLRLTSGDNEKGEEIAKVLDELDSDDGITFS